MFMHAFLKCVLAAAVTVTQVAAAEPSLPVGGAKRPRVELPPVAENLLGEISDWLVQNFELAAPPEGPAIRFLSQAELQDMRHSAAQDGSHHQPAREPAGEAGAEGGVVALYDHASRTIFLPDDWTASRPADQSVLVHEMVHHLQNAMRLRFECPAEREKLAYKAQNRWLGRFGTDLETEFKLDPFSVLMASACM